MKKIRKRSGGHSKKKKRKTADISDKLVLVRQPQAIINHKYLSPPEPDIIKAYEQNTPFPFVALQDFADDKFAEEVLEELKKAKWFRKRNDLYTFKQTDDLINATEPGLRDFREAVYSQCFRDYLHGVTGIEVNTKVDLAGQQYRKGCNLLCHDDELDGRRIAFIWYLVPKDWTEGDGGHFCLYGNDNGQPSVEPVNKFVPCWNTVLFFETTPTTWHQVSEVIADKKDRYSISGWFHGTVLKRPSHIPEQALPQIPATELPSGFSIEEWIDSKYLEQEAQQTIRKHFERNSSIGLPDFLVKEKFFEVLVDLDKSDWKTIGPPTRRHYGSLGRGKGERETGHVLNMKNFLRSKEMVSFIETLTGLTIVSAEEGEVRCFKKQDYTLVHDSEYQHQAFGLDLYLNIQDTSEWESEQGGFITYMDSDSELLAIPPAPNVLSLVYRDTGCMKFVKFLTSDAPSNRYDFQNTFITLDTDDNKEEDSESGEEEDVEGELQGELQSDE